MAESQKSETTFLQDSSLDQLEAAVAWNHHTWMTTKARAGGGEIHEENGVTWVFMPGRESEGMILFPRLTEASAADQLDRIIQFYQNLQPAKSIICWSLDPFQPRDLGVRLLARGFQQGWRPCWMWLDFQKMTTDFPQPDGLRIEIVEDATGWDVDNLPYYDAVTEAIRHAAVCTRPQRVWHFAAWLNGKPVAHSVMFLTTGDLGIAGIYDVGVVPEVRNQGIGKAVTIAACLQGQKMGCCHAMLNGTGERMYVQIGFERIGYGMTWWLNVARLGTHPPPSMRIAFAEAIGRGDIVALDRLEKQIEKEDYAAPLTNGMTPMELAVELRKTTSAQWLFDRGAQLDVLSAWDLGWKDRATALLAKNPELVNRRSGEWLMTPLHTAAQRGDVELARLILTANPDLDIKDEENGGTPLGWAHHFQRTDIIELIEKHQADKSGS